jgi:hypothetical protein
MSIEHGLVNGREATIAYFDDTWTPREPSEATLCKVHFDDGLGPIMLLRLRPPPKVEGPGKSPQALFDRRTGSVPTSKRV